MSTTRRQNLKQTITLGTNKGINYYLVKHKTNNYVITLSRVAFKETFKKYHNFELTQKSPKSQYPPCNRISDNEIE